jgi:hypothetical protein
MGARNRSSSRRRTLQTSPERVRQLIADCQVRGLSNIRTIPLKLALMPLTGPISHAPARTCRSRGVPESAGYAALTRRISDGGTWLVAATIDGIKGRRFFIER